MVGSSWSVEVEPRPFGGKEFQSFRTDRGITFCPWPACGGGQVPIPGGSLSRSRSGRPVEPVNPRAGCPGPGPRTDTAAFDAADRRRPRPRTTTSARFAGDPGQVQTRETGPGVYGFDAPPEA